MSKRRPVKKLDISTVNRIAAGEVVNRPAHAVKEMLENSLDAESTSIHVVVKDGGMKLLQIQDNGVGIAKEDLVVVCERFTTSKLETFDDLRSISTYGFRGEALCSISHISHLTIASKTDDEKCGYKVSYIDGKMRGIPVPCGLNRGTQITVENMFNNVPLRQKMLKNFNEEFCRIRDVVARYAIHNASVGFSLKKYGCNDVIVKTLPNSIKTENIRSIFGSSVARNLMEVEETDEILQLNLHVISTSLDYHSPQLTFLLFINHRLVDAEGLRKELDTLYGLYLPQGTHPFIYISLEMAAENVDVNVHPTKHSVFYLHEDAINKKVRTTIQQLILAKQGSRNIPIQILSPTSITNPLGQETTVLKEKPEQYPYEKVRTDASDQKIDSFLQPLKRKDSIENESKNKSEPDSSLGKMYENRNSMNLENEIVKDIVNTNFNETEEDCKNITVQKEKKCDEQGKQMGPSSSFDSHNDFISKESHSNLRGTLREECSANSQKVIYLKENCNTESDCLQENVCGTSIDCDRIFDKRREFSLTSLETLRKLVIDECDYELKRVLRDASYVGCLDYQYILMQHSTHLYLCNIKDFCKAFFYQVMLCEFGNFGVMKLSQPISLSFLIESALSCEECSPSKVESLTQTLKNRSDMLEDYFSIQIDTEGNILSFPWLLQKYSPHIMYFPEYVLKLASEVNWEDELRCFEGVCQTTAWFYSQIPSKENAFKNNEEWDWTLEHVLFPIIKRYVYPPKSIIKNLSLCHITDFKNLFSVFERC